MKLVEDWKQCYKWLSVHAMVIQGAVATVQGALSTYAQPVMSAKAFAFTMVGLSVLAVAGRLIRQDDKGTDAQ